MPTVVLLCNLPVLAGEIYAGHKGAFYDTIRQGATGEMVDAAAYIRKTFPKDVVVCTNDFIRRREIYLMTGRAIAIYKPMKIGGPDAKVRIRNFFLHTGATCAIIHFEDAKYPEWHFDLSGHKAKPRSWWGLYVWDARRKQPVRVIPPKDRQWLRWVPDSAL